MEWLAAKSLFGMRRWMIGAIALAIIAIVVAGAITVLNHTVDSALETITTTAEEKGAADAVNAGNETTLGQVEATNEAGNQVRAGRSRAKFDQCVQDSEPGFAGNCERYRPDEPVSDRPGDPRPASP